MSSNQKVRVERDSLGELEVPENALWGPQTQRAINNFPISGEPMPSGFVQALGLVKWAAAGANAELGLLTSGRARAIQTAALMVAAGDRQADFPVDVFQTGSGTSSNMNANEVIAALACEAGADVHANDHVNMSQSSNDVVPSALHIATKLACSNELVPALAHLIEVIDARAEDLGDVVKTGRTHLMDAMPVTLGQAFSGWSSQLGAAKNRLHEVAERLTQLALGGTAVGTGVNAHPRFGAKAAVLLSEHTGLDFRAADNHFAAQSAQDTSVELAAVLKTLAVALTKIANDLRWMSSGPLSGLAELDLPALQPGSSIMPGKVNPVLPEAVAMVAARVMGNDVSVTIAGQSGVFELNVMLPIIIKCNLESIEISANSIRLLADNCIAGAQPNRTGIAANVARNPILVTALNPVIGYELGAKIAKTAYATGRPVRDVALELTDLTGDELDRLLDPQELTRGGIRF